MHFLRSLVALALSVVVIRASGQQYPERQIAQQPASIVGVVTDTDDALIPNAVIHLSGDTPSDQRSTQADGNAAFAINGLHPGSSLHLNVTAPGFADWDSGAIALSPGQTLDLQHIRLSVAAVVTAVSAATAEEIATRQIRDEEGQRVLGIVPNFYVMYDKQFVPLTPRLKFNLALRSSTDPVTFAGAGFIAGIDQAADVSPHYVQGAKGYGQRFGASYLGAVTNITLGGAILPTLLHQDPRYFYQGTGSKKSRALHAMEAPFVAKGDDGRWQPNYSSIGGDFASSAVTNLYYPSQDRGGGLVVRGALEVTGGRIVNSLIQEFVLARFTTHHDR